MVLLFGTDGILVLLIKNIIKHGKAVVQIYFISLVKLLKFSIALL